MECHEAEKLIPQYLNDSMDKDTLLEFISHIRECKSCYNELDTFFMLEKAMDALQTDEDQSFDLSKKLDEDLNRRWQMIGRNDTSRHLMVFFGFLAVIAAVWMVLDLYGILSLSYLL